jgi:hypothetical protein
MGPEPLKEPCRVGMQWRLPLVVQVVLMVDAFCGWSELQG